MNVSIDDAIDSFMQNPDAGTVLVNSAILGAQPANMIASAFGHELVHVSDHLSGVLSVFDPVSVASSEVRAYRWQQSTRKHFNLTRPQNVWVRNQISKCKEEAGR